MRLVKAIVCLDYFTDFLEFWILGNYLFKPDSIKKFLSNKVHLQEAHLKIALIFSTLSLNTCRKPFLASEQTTTFI